MGKSTASCFRIISCGGDSVDHDDLQTPESKGSGDRRGWSFRKRSATHRVLSNSVTSEAPASASKESQESISVSCQVQPDLTVAEKTTETQQIEEKSELSSFLDSKLSDNQVSGEDDFGADAPPDEPSIILIQTAIRGLLARRVLLKEKSITKLQAVVRGHIVRSHAVGTLRCVQAIIKMQALVRARHGRQLVEESGAILKHRESNGQSKKEAKASGTYTYVSIEKLLSNAFARQLMEATPRTKPINIKCDPSKSDSAWKWLERWMSVSSVSNEEPQGTGAAVEQHKDDIGHSGRKEEDLFVQIISKSTDSESGVDASNEVSNDNNMTSCDANDLDVHSSRSISPSSIQCSLQNSDLSDSRYEVKEFAPTEMKRTDLVEMVEAEYLSKKEESQNEEEILTEAVEAEYLPKEKESNEEEILNEEVEVKYLPKKEVTGIVQDAPDSKKLSSVQPETEVKCLSRKASSPAFIAAQSKFEELSLGATSAKLTTSSSHDPGVESSLDKVSSANQDQPFRSEDKDSGLAGNSISNASAVQRGSSECGTELSISSTLDSPDRLEAGINDRGMEIKASDETNKPRSSENLELEAKSVVLEADASSNNTIKLERDGSVDSVCGESLNSGILADTPQLEKPADPSPVQVELGSEMSHQVNELSPEASPRSHATIPESQATPSSQVSVKLKNSKGEKSRSNRKSRPSSDDKNLSNHNQDSASKSSLEQLQEHKSGGKRCNSFGSAKPDQREQEPRDSSSSNSLPSYMQATESARAKAIANGSPRSSPDVHDKDIYIKKRHSLPGTNERQGSPRIHRSLSQAQQNTKGNASHSPQDRKWRR
ncbi:IQ-domain 32 [Perilla frutescens var. hirtella]|nr:IQ-domain 32 [Perilla frutescens var. hirtella]